MELAFDQFGMILRSSISNKRVLSISPWFLSTKSRARWPYETDWNLAPSGKKMHGSKVSPKIFIHYRKCCWSWSTLVEVILRVSQFRGHYDPASLWRGTWNCMHRLCEQYIVLIFPVLIFWSKLKEESMKFFARTVSMDNNPRGVLPKKK